MQHEVSLSFILKMILISIIEDIINFYQRLNISPQEIRDSIQNLSWKNQMKRVIDALFPS